MKENLQFAMTWQTGLEAQTFWNNRAKSYNEQAVQSCPSREALIDYYVSIGALTQDSVVLDLGCGPGNFTKLIAPHVKQVIGVDISDEMLKYARENTRDFSNVRFMNLDWWETDIQEIGFENHFDFVFANMTPSVKDEDTFLKMINCSKKYCYFSTFVYRFSNLDSILQKSSEPYRNCRLVFNLLWDRHIFPQITYYNRQEDRQLTPEEAMEMMDAAVRERIAASPAELFQDFMENGMIPYHLRSRYAQMFWCMDDRLITLGQDVPCFDEAMGGNFRDQ